MESFIKIGDIEGTWVGWFCMELPDILMSYFNSAASAVCWQSECVNKLYIFI